ncbi:MAG: electron transport complex subunit E [Bacteroidales bacterium]|nr:electron transport complex subunit E [Bacteroidales bacterium]
MSNINILTKGILKENAVFVMLLGLCPVLGTTTSAINGLGMGLATLFVLLLSNIVVSLIKDIVPAMVRIPAYIVVIASLVTILQLLMQAFTPGIYATLGLFIPLIVVNCMILGRAEGFASKNTVMDSILDALGMGLGFTLALTLLGGVREILGSGSLFDMKFMDGDGMLVFVLAPGGFFGLGFIIAGLNWYKRKQEAKLKLQPLEIKPLKK